MIPQARRGHRGAACLALQGHGSIPPAWLATSNIGSTCSTSNIGSAGITGKHSAWYSAASCQYSSDDIRLQFSQATIAGALPTGAQAPATGSTGWGQPRSSPAQWLQVWLAAVTPVLQHTAQCLWQPNPKPLLLASLTSATASRAAASGGAQRKLPKRPQQVPPLVSMSVPEAFQRIQRTAWAIWEYYKDKGEVFPRPCPACGSCSFFETDSNSQQQQAVTAQGGAITSIRWESRPLACEQCHRWWHMGCLGIHAMEDVPSQPWFHANSCRHMFLSLECEAERRELPAWELGPDAGDQPLCRGDVASVYELLSDALPANLLLGLGNAHSEYAGGRYMMLLCRRDPAPGKSPYPQRTPVAAATFDVYGPHAAQLHLLATSQDERGKGHARALLDVLEYRLRSHGVQQLVAQPRADQLQLFTDRLGFEVMHPADAAVAHQHLPIAYFDAALVDKSLK